jgi:Flp pilus assembly protein TadG
MGEMSTTSVTGRIASGAAARLKEERAQGVVEFAIVITMLLFFFLGTIDFSRFMYYDTAIRNAARVGAEVAGNYCNMPDCGIQSSPTSDNVVMQAAYCEATQNQLASGLAQIKLQPTVSCTPCTTVTCNPCASSACATCTKDICIDPSGTRTQGSAVSVYVGYNFQPVSFYMRPFFHTRTCFPAGEPSENTHTICASATGRVSAH